MRYKGYFFSALMFFTPSEVLFAHQPVMDMAPRWGDGYGFQLRYESFGSNKLLSQNDEVSNLLGLERSVNVIWLEGVYTFDRSLRVTIKIPSVEQTRTKVVNAAPVAQANSGLGDVIVGLPLKYYINSGAMTENYGFTPSLRLPTGDADGVFPISDGSTDLGLSFSYSKETAKYYYLIDLFYWINQEGSHGMREGNQLGLDFNFGIHPWHNNQTNSGMFLMWDVSLRSQKKSNGSTLTTASAGERIQSGPILVLYRDNIMFRAEYKWAAHEKTKGLANSRGDEVNIGIGFTF